MKTKHPFIITAILVCIAEIVSSQSTIPGTVRPTTPAFLGWGGTGGNNGSLEIRNNFTGTIEPIIFYSGGTNDAITERMRITTGTTPYGPGTRIGVSHQSNATYSIGTPVSSPQAMLHMGSGAAPSLGYRLWMDIGTYLEYRGDHAYFGLKDEYEDGGMDAVINWGDNTEPEEASHFLRFIYSWGDVDPDLEDPGNEIARMTPWGNVGIGDFYDPDNANIINPQRRLDILDGGLDKPQLRLTYTRDADVDLGINTDFQTTEDGNMLINPSDNGTSKNVGINLTPSDVIISKLHVNNTNQPIGTLSSTTLSSSTATNLGIWGSSRGSIVSNIGVLGTASYSTTVTPSALYNIGVLGRATGSKFENIGGAFEANECRPNGLNIGVYASAVGTEVSPDNCVAGVAGYFNGYIHITSPPYITSDTMFKDSIEDISGALATLSQIQTKSFVFKRSEYPYINLAVGRHMGVLAEQIDSIVPEVVKTVTQPQILDSSGTVLMDTLSFKAVAYDELIPLLISAVNELNDTMVTTCGPTTLTNRVPKWNDSTKTLCNSLIYDDGMHIGITNGIFPETINPAATVSIITDTDTAAIQGEGVMMGARFRGPKTGVFGVANGGADTTAHDEFHVGVLGMCENAPEVNVGVIGSAETATDTAANVGMIGFSANSPVANVGMAGFSDGGDTSLNIGVYAESGLSHFENYGGRFQIFDSIGASYAVYGKVKHPDAESFAGFFDGDVYTSGVYLPSDGKLKENIEDIDDAMSILSRLQAKKYEYKTSEYQYLNLPKGRQYGLLAEEAALVVPQLVRNIVSPEQRDTSHTLLGGKVLSPPIHFNGINYDSFIALLISATQQQQQIINQQQEVIDSLSQASAAQNTRLSEMESRINNCCGERSEFRIADPGSGDGEDEVTRISVELSSMQYIVLDQNVPNPFAEQTTIPYFIPEERTTDNGQLTTISKAQIIFFDISGRIIKTADLEKGNGIITVFAPNLSSGTYSYSLLIDGKAVETKKMVKMK